MRSIGILYQFLTAEFAPFAADIIQTLGETRFTPPPGTGDITARLEAVPVKSTTSVGKGTLQQRTLEHAA